MLKLYRMKVITQFGNRNTSDIEKGDKRGNLHRSGRMAALNGVDKSFLSVISYQLPRSSFHPFRIHANSSSRLKMLLTFLELILKMRHQ